MTTSDTPRPRLRIVLLDDTRVLYVIDRAAHWQRTGAEDATAALQRRGERSLVFADEIDLEVVVPYRQHADEPVDDHVDQGDEPIECDHPSSSGIDQRPLDDPRKVWKCDVCDVLHTSEPVDITAGPLDPVCGDPWCIDRPLGDHLVSAHAPTAPTEHAPGCDLTHLDGSRCSRFDQRCPWCGVMPATQHLPTCGRPDPVLGHGLHA